MLFPFEANLKDILENPDPYVNSVFSCLESEFLTMPKGNGFVDYIIFEQGYETLKKATVEFSIFTPEKIFETVLQVPITLVVIRSILGFTPPEWAYVASQHSEEKIDQGFVRSLDRKIRLNPLAPIKGSDAASTKLKRMIEVSCDLISTGAPSLDTDRIHRLDKVDTKFGLVGTQNCAKIGVPYAMLLYERFLGRPFAGHRDSVSDLIGDSLESIVEDELTKAGISFRKTKRAEKIKGFDQTPDFIIPSEFNPQIIIEAKITEDDGTARDKATRIQHLGELSLAGTSQDKPNYEVIGCIGGRGFGVRREDMKKMLIATRGKLFTIKTINQMIENTRLKEYRTK